MNRMIRLHAFAAAGCVILFAAGCGSDNNSAVSGIPTGQAQDMTAQRTSFEKSEDPPLSANTHYAAGQFAESQGAFPQAIKQYETALKLDPRNAPSLYRLGLIYIQTKDYPRSIDAWRKYLAVTNNSAIGYSNLGYAQQLADDPRAAEQSYLTGIQRDPKNRACRVNYGVMLAKQGRPDEALAQFQAVLSPAESHYNLASVYERTGQRERAKAEYAKALECDPTFSDAQVKLAELK